MGYDKLSMIPWTYYDSCLSRLPESVPMYNIETGLRVPQADFPKSRLPQRLHDAVGPVRDIFSACWRDWWKDQAYEEDQDEVPKLEPDCHIKVWAVICGMRGGNQDQDPFDVLRNRVATVLDLDIDSDALGVDGSNLAQEFAGALVKARRTALGSNLHEDGSVMTFPWDAEPPRIPKNIDDAIDPEVCMHACMHVKRKEANPTSACSR